MSNTTRVPSVYIIYNIEKYNKCMNCTVHGPNTNYNRRVGSCVRDAFPMRVLNCLICYSFVPIITKLKSVNVIDTDPSLWGRISTKRGRFIALPTETFVRTRHCLTRVNLPKQTPNKDVDLITEAYDSKLTSRCFSAVNWAPPPHTHTHTQTHTLEQFV